MFVSKKIARFISLFAFITATGAVYILLGKTAFAFPTPTPGSTESGKINIIVHVDPSDVTGVSVTATRDNTKDGLTNTMNFTQQSDKSWISDGITLGSGYTTCAPGHEGDFSFLIVAKKGNLKAQTDAAFCGHDVPGANVNYDFGTIKIPATAVDTGTITGHFTFINNAGKTKPFGVSTNATLKGGPDNSTYNLKVDKNGSVTFNGSIPVGTYTLKADYIPSGEDPDDGTSNQEILKDNLSIKKGSNDLSSQLANGNVSGSGGSGGDAAGADPNIDCPVTPNPLTWIMCPFINLMQGTVGHLDNAINALLNTNADQIFKTNCTTANADLCKTGIAYYKAWNVFRLFGIAFIILVVLL